MPVRLLPLTLALSCFLFALAGAAHARSESGFLNRMVRIGKDVYKYQVFVPATWTKARQWPVVLFLHGAGERGDDGLVQTHVGIGAAIRQRADRFPCIVVLPQCRRSQWWTADIMETMAMKALDQSIKEFKGDPRRILLTGLSMGGYGTWGLASKYPGRFAALVPICGGVRPIGRVPQAVSPAPASAADPYAEIARKVGGTPVWIFHGAADKTVSVEESRRMHEALKSAGGSVRYTEYEGVGHNSWDKAYAEPDLMPWLLAKSLSKR